MPTAAERQALAFLAGVALLGGGVRVWQQRHVAGAASSAVAFNSNSESVDGQLSAVDAERAVRRGKKAGGKSKVSSKKTASGKDATRTAHRDNSAITNDAPPRVIDVDVATAQELEQLPRVGAALAERIVANRDSLGAFGSLEALGTVRGIGDSMLKSLDPLVMFSGRPRAKAPPVDRSASTRPRVRKRSKANS